jgi:hypothetical protein
VSCHEFRIQHDPNYVSEYDRMFKGNWTKTSTPHVWFCEERGLYTWNDEAEMFTDLYSSQQEATEAMEYYVKHVLGP